MSGLAHRWERLCAALDGDAQRLQTLGEALRAAYDGPTRRYHTGRHLAEVLDALEELAPAASPAATLAVWFHDAVYDPVRGDNEERSARWAEAALADAGLEAALIARVGAMVRATAAHDLDQPSGAAYPDELAAVLDADLAILGAAPERCREYAAAIRAEYSHLDEPAFRAGRRAVLQALAARRRLYRTAAGAARWEAAARRNLAAELAELAQPDPA
ncbi:MAG: hypothetical protein ACKVWR_22210 [Acidimicrobiales bacterium]